MKIIIASFYHEKDINPKFPMSLMELSLFLREMGVDYEFWTSEEREVDKSKNKMVYNFLLGDFTHFFVIEPTLGWDTRGMARFLKAVKMGGELVSGIYPQYGIFDADPEICENGMLKGYDTKDFRLIEANYVNGGFTIYSRKAFERVKDSMDSYTAKNEADDEYSITEFFKMTKNMKGTEDKFFQKKYKELGGQILIEPNITFDFIGRRKWRSNYSQSLLGVPVI